MFRIPKEGPKPNMETWVLPSGNINLGSRYAAVISVWLRQSNFVKETPVLRKEAGRRVWEEEPAARLPLPRSGLVLTRPV